jgi:UPF0716 protein FxsA
MESVCSCVARWDGDGEDDVLRRLPIIICGVVALDLLLVVTFSCCFGWRLPLAEVVATSAFGLSVIVYYELRWSKAVMKCLASETGLLDRQSLERMLLLVAGVVLLIPGILTDTLALVLMVPWVRRQIAVRCNLCR